MMQLLTNPGMLQETAAKFTTYLSEVVSELKAIHKALDEINEKMGDKDAGAD